MVEGDRSLQELYTSKLQPIIKELELTRLKLRSRAQMGLYTVPFAAIVGFFVLNHWLSAFLAALIPIVLISQINRRPYEEYRRQFKRRVIQAAIKACQPGLHYTPTEGITQAEFTSSQIYSRNIDRYHSEDLVRGKIGATRFRFSEIVAERKANKEMETVFSGIFFVANFNKSFNSQTLVSSDLIGQIFGEKAGAKLASHRKTKVSSRPGELVKLEDPVFNSLFSVYSTDQVEARYILSTSLMQRLIDFVKRRNALNSKNPMLGISLSFIKSIVYIALPTSKNYFEPPSLWAKSAALKLTDLEDYLADLQIAQDIIEELNLNLRIWGV